MRAPGQSRRSIGSNRLSEMEQGSRQILRLAFALTLELLDHLFLGETSDLKIVVQCRRPLGVDNAGYLKSLFLRHDTGADILAGKVGGTAESAFHKFEIIMHSGHFALNALVMLVAPFDL